MDTVSQTFKRSQVEWALWKFFSGDQWRDQQPPGVFRTRIKRLLELDKDMGQAEQTTGATNPFAFSSVPPEGRGVEIPFSSVDTLCIAFALDLLDAGFNQAEIVFLMRHIRSKLEKQHSRIMRNPPSPRQKISATEYSNEPSYIYRSIKIIDRRVFVLIGKVELTEVFSRPAAKGRNHKPIVYEPRFCSGIEALRNQLHRMSFNNRKVFVLEMAEMAVMLANFLRDAPLIKRGRK